MQYETAKELIITWSRKKMRVGVPREIKNHEYRIEFALNNATLPFIIKLADLGATTAMAADSRLANGLNVMDGRIRRPKRLAVEWLSRDT